MSDQSNITDLAERIAKRRGAASSADVRETIRTTVETLLRSVAERMGAIILSALVAHTGWHWMTERFDRLRQYRFEWPAIDAVFLLALTRWLIIVVAAAGAVWLVTTLARQYARNTGRSVRL